MSLFGPLIGFGLRQVIGDGIENIVAAVQQRFRDHSQRLPTALQRAHERAWQAIGIALGCDGILAITSRCSSPPEMTKVSANRWPSFSRPTRYPSRAPRPSFAGPAWRNSNASARAASSLRKNLQQQTSLARQPSSIAAAKRQELIGKARQYGKIADALREDYPNLARLLRMPTPGGLLASTFCYFFRREVETDEELAHGLFFAGHADVDGVSGKAVHRGQQGPRDG